MCVLHALQDSNLAFWHSITIRKSPKNMHSVICTTAVMFGVQWSALVTQIFLACQEPAVTVTLHCTSIIIAEYLRTRGGKDERKSGTVSFLPPCRVRRLSGPSSGIPEVTRRRELKGSGKCGAFSVSWCRSLLLFVLYS